MTTEQNTKDQLIEQLRKAGCAAVQLGYEASINTLTNAILAVQHGGLAFERIEQYQAAYAAEREKLESSSKTRAQDNQEEVFHASLQQARALAGTLNENDIVAATDNASNMTTATELLLHVSRTPDALQSLKLSLLSPDNAGSVTGRIWMREMWVKKTAAAMRETGGAMPFTLIDDSRPGAISIPIAHADRPATQVPIRVRPPGS